VESMYVDIACNSRTVTDNDVREILFSSVQRHLNGMVLLPQFIPSTKDFCPEGMDLSCFIDYPYGSSDTSVRSHAAITAIRKGATVLDVVANSGLLTNGKKAKFYDDIETIKALTDDQKVLLRILLEYRLFEAQDIVNIGNVLREMGIEFVVPATGIQMDSWEDNLAISMELTEKANMSVITNGGIRTRRHYEAVAETKVFGIRFTNHKIVEEVL